MPMLKPENHQRVSSSPSRGAVHRASHQPRVSRRNGSPPQEEGKGAQACSSVLCSPLNLSSQYPWPTGLEIMKNNEKFQKHLTGEHQDCVYPKSGFGILSSHPTSPLCISERAFQREEEAEDRPTCGTPWASGWEGKSKPTSAARWTRGKGAGWQPTWPPPARCCWPGWSQGSGPCPWPYPRAGSALRGRATGCVASPAQGVLGHCMAGGWQRREATLREPGDKGEKYRLKQQKEASLPFALGCLEHTRFFGKFITS